MTIEPGTVITSLKISYKVWKAFLDHKKHKKVMKELGNITGLLKDVIMRQDQILNELRTLRLHIREDMRAEFLFDLESDLQAIMMRVETQIGRVDSVGDITVLNYLIKESFTGRLEHLAWKMNRYGPIAVSGALSTAIYFVYFLGLLRELGANRQSIDSLERSFLTNWDKRFFSVWLDAGQLGSLVYNLSELSQEKKAIRNRIDNHPRRVYQGFLITERLVMRPGGWACQRGADHYLIITGDVLNGFTGRVITEGSRLVNCQGGGGTGSGPAMLPGALINEPPIEELEDTRPIYPEEEELIAYNEPIADNSAFGMPLFEEILKEGYGIDFMSVPVVDNPIINNLNKKALHWKSLVEQEARLKVLINWVEEIRKSFNEHLKEQ